MPKTSAINKRQPFWQRFIQTAAGTLLVVPSVIFMAAVVVQGIKTLIAETAVYALPVWPQDANLLIGESVQLVEAFLLADGTILCTDGPDNEHLEDPPNPDEDYASEAPWVNSECMSAAALLPDTIARHVRFSWMAQPDSIIVGYDSIVYHVLLEDGAAVLFDSAQAHPDTTFEWAGGVTGQAYAVSVYSVAFADPERRSAPPSVPVSFTYPEALVVLLDPIQLPPVTVDTLP